jgi:hypothetical protein
MHVRPIDFGRYRRKPDFSLGLGKHVVDIFVGQSLWLIVPDDDAAYWDEFSYALQCFIFSRTRLAFDGKSSDPVATLRFFKAGMMRSGVFDTTHGLVTFVMHHNRGKFHVNVNVMQPHFGSGVSDVGT